MKAPEIEKIPIDKGKSRVYNAKKSKGVLTMFAIHSNEYRTWSVDPMYGDGSALPYAFFG